MPTLCVKLWHLILQPYTFVVEHEKRRDNANADALSQLDDDTLHKVPEKEGGNVMDDHFINEVICYRCQTWQGKVAAISALLSIMRPWADWLGRTPLRWWDLIVGGGEKKTWPIKHCQKELLEESNHWQSETIKKTNWELSRESGKERAWVFYTVCVLPFGALSISSLINFLKESSVNPVVGDPLQTPHVLLNWACSQKLKLIIIIKVN